MCRKIVCACGWCMESVLLSRRHIQWIAGGAPIGCRRKRSSTEVLEWMDIISPSTCRPGGKGAASAAATVEPAAQW